jgi:DNA repair exonuclease SbcCD ATPase subunit
LPSALAPSTNCTAQYELHGLSKAAEQSQQQRQQLEVAQARLDVLEQTRQASPIGRLEESATRLCRQRDEALEALARLANEMRTREQERDSLQTQIDDLAGNRDKVVAERKAAAAAAKKAAQAAHKAYAKVNETAQSARAQLEAAEADMAAAVRRLDEAKEQQAATSGAIIEAAAAEAERFAEYEAARAELDSCQKALKHRTIAIWSGKDSTVNVQRNLVEMLRLQVDSRHCNLLLLWHKLATQLLMAQQSSTLVRFMTHLVLFKRVTKQPFLVTHLFQVKYKNWLNEYLRVEVLHHKNAKIYLKLELDL